MLLGAIGIVSTYTHRFTFKLLDDSKYFYAIGLGIGFFYLLFKKYRKYSIYPMLLFFGLVYMVVLISA